MNAEERCKAEERILAHPAVKTLLANYRERIAQAIDEAADEHNRRIAAIAGVPYDPTRRDGMVASGIRQAARIAREVDAA